MDYHAISNLKPIRKYDWKIRVRVTRKWFQRIGRSECCNGLNLILVDEHVSITMIYVYCTFKLFNFLKIILTFFSS